MELLKIKFDELWPGFNTVDNDFTRILSKKYAIEISDEPDFFFFTHPYNGKRNYLNHKCHRIFLGWENERADWTMCDYVLDSDFVSDKPRHKRFPIWAAWDMNLLTRPKPPFDPVQKTKFCCMVVSNGKAKERIEFFHKLSAYKKVDSGGRYLNNVGVPVENKRDFIKDYKFVIAFENSSYPGYTTEKLIEPMFVNSIPIYWGNTKVGVDFNTKSFVDVTSFETMDEAVEFIVQLDNDETMFKNMMQETWFKENKIPVEFTEAAILDYFNYIIKDCKTKKPVAQSVFYRNLHRALLLKRNALWRFKLNPGKGNFRVF